MFGDTAAGTLRNVLRERGGGEEVAVLSDCLAIGPIASQGWQERAAWLDDIDPAPLDVERDRIRISTEEFLEKIRSGERERLIWIAPQSACEQCGLQWYFHQFPDAPAGPMIILDWTLTPGWRDGPPIGLGELPEYILAGLLDKAERRRWPQDRSSPELWERLRAEDSLLRIVDEGCLRSVQPDFFDALLLDQASHEWRSWARVAGNAMMSAGERGHNIGGGFLIWRVRELVRQGRIECRGELPGRDHDETNRPDAMLRMAGG